MNMQIEINSATQREDFLGNKTEITFLNTFYIRYSMLPMVDHSKAGIYEAEW